MKAVTGYKGQTQTYPYLGHWEGVVVLFTEKDTGTCVDIGLSTNTLGMHRDHWAEKMFRRLDGSVTLSND